MPIDGTGVRGERVDEIFFIDSADEPANEVGTVRSVNGEFHFRDALGLFNPRTGGSGITAEQHLVLRQLIHFLETNSPGDGFGAGPLYCETNYTGTVFPTDETWYETSAKLKKICRWEGTYNANKTFATEKWIVYQVDGVSPAADATDTISYTGVIETSRSRAIVVY